MAKRIAGLAFIVCTIVGFEAVAEDGWDTSVVGNESLTSGRSLSESGTAGSSTDLGPDGQSENTISAETGDFAASKSRPINRLLEEVIVTAQKRKESPQDVPISLQAFSAENLEARGVLDNFGLPKITPGLTITQQVGYTTTYIRGIGSDAFLLADPSVVNYIDGIYQPFALSLVQDFGAVERIEVLKGPQGTLFGRNALGGAINVITKDSSTESVEVSLQAVIGSFQQSNNRLHVNLPIANWLAVSLSGVFSTQEAHHDGRLDVRPDNTDGRDLPKEKSQAGRFKLRLLPAEWLDINLAYYRLDIEGTGTVFAVNTEPSLISELAGVRPMDPYNGENNEAVYSEAINENFYGKVDINAPWLDIKVLASEQRIVSRQLFDYDGARQPLVTFALDPGVADVRTTELQLLSNEGSWGSDWLEWILGAYYFDATQGLSGFLQAATTDLDRGLLLGARLPEVVPATLEALLGDSLLPTGTVDAVGLVGTESLAIFSQVKLDVTSWLSLTGGLRWQNEERVLIESSSGLRTLGGQVVPLQNFSGRDNPDFRDTTRSLDPKLVLEMRPNWQILGPDAMLYASWQTATKSSTFNAVNITDDPEYVRAEELTAWELGMKAQLFDGMASLNLAAFQYNIEDQQVQFISVLEGGIATFENAAEAQIQGLEIETTAQLFPSLWSGLVLNMAYAFLDSEYVSFPDGSGFDEDTGLLTQNNDFTGNQVVRTPELSGTIGLTQAFDLPSLAGTIEVGASYYYNSGFYYLAQNTPNVQENAYELVDARLTYIHNLWNLRVSVFGNNLLGEKYNYSRLATDFGTSDAVAPLRSIGLRLNWDYSF
tara:strand:+ start:13237 stop:15720 length:2484 start_codon:yes stop_codon:yes gene_type:complete